MATNTNINFPQSEFLDPRTQRPAREWMLWLMSPSVIQINSANALSVTSGGTGLSTIPTNGQLLIGNGTGYTLDTLTPSAGISVTNASGVITLANTGVLSWAGGSTGLAPAAATTGAVTLSGLLNVSNGGTGQSTYTNGQLLIGNTTGNTLGKSTLTAGTGIAITNGPGSVTIASDKAYGRFAGLSTQSAAAVATAYKVVFDATYLGNNVTMVSTTDATVTVAGIYNFQYSLQFIKNNVGVGSYYFWVRVNGSDVVVSAKGVSVATDSLYALGTGNIILSLNAGDYFTLMWSVSDIGCQLIATPGTPDIPSATLTVQQV